MLYGIDAELTRILNNLSGHSAIADTAAMLISATGVPLMVLAVASQWWARSDRGYVRHLLLSAGFKFLMALGINQIIIQLVQRVRPFELGVTHLLGAASSDPSFPSDHAAASFAIAFAFIVYRVRRQSAIFACAAALISISRVYIGTHYVSDILGGIATALCAALIVNATFRQKNWLSQRLVRIF